MYSKPLHFARHFLEVSFYVVHSFRYIIISMHYNQCIPLHSSSTENTLLVCLFNARSVGTSRRRSDISTFMLENNIDIMLLTETWLHPAGDEAKIADLAPPGYSVLSFPRSSGGPSVKGGGIAFVLRDSLMQHVSSTSSFPVQHLCFEAAQLTLTYNKQLTNFFCFYRPPPSKKKKKKKKLYRFHVFRSIFRLP